MAKAIDGITDGIEQGRAAARDKAVVIKWQDFGDGDGIVDGQNFVVEEHKGQPEQTGSGLFSSSDLRGGGVW